MPHFQLQVFPPPPGSVEWGDGGWRTQYEGLTSTASAERMAAYFSSIGFRVRLWKGKVLCKLVLDR